ncbi:MAG: hypothetical protein ACLQVY_12290 [Limisphaerales bacterium]
MKNIHTKSGVSQNGHGSEIGNGENLPGIEKLLARCLNVGWLIFKKLNSIDESIAILAGQKKRELDADKEGEAPAQ